MWEKVKEKAVYLPEIALGIATIWLRMAYLGYSDYQGDEIKALFLPGKDQSITEFLLNQRKGPVQFFITFILKFINPTYTNELLIRLPFALAGIFAVYFFYKLVKLHFGRKTAFFAAFFLSTNGFLVAFSRIVQYQSFVIFFMILALYMFSLTVKNETWRTKGIYAGFLFWALSILSHYDGVFIAPFIGYLILRWFAVTKRTPHRFKHLMLGGIIFAGMLAVFYIPFVLAISDATKSYWQNRVSGGEGKISSSVYLFSVYHPIYVIHFYTLLGVLGGTYGVLSIIWRLILSKILAKFNERKVVGKVIELIRQFVVLEPLKTIIALFLWVLVPLVFLELFVNVPGTHIYTYLVPATVVLGFGIIFVMRGIRLIFGKLTGDIVSVTGLVVLFTFLFLQTSAVFVGHAHEYPWENEPFLYWEFHKPSPVFHLSMFGFPYYRHWEEIGEFINTGENNGYYSTNERESITRHFVLLNKDSTEAGHFIYIINPQSFTDQIIYEKPAYWVQHYDPVLTFFKGGKEIAKIYYMPKGTLEEINVLGY